MAKARKSYNLAERRRQRAEAFGGITYPIDGEDGQVVEIPYMAFWSDKLTHAVWDGDYPGDTEVLRMAIRETWPEEADERLAAFEDLGLQTGDVMEIIGEVLKVKPTDDEDTSTADADEDGRDEGTEPGPGSTPAKAGSLGKSRNSSTR
ncbi:hypothetical protein ACQPZ8_01370 [Actinomadura nitritigenes]|uniref:hypothetical protein n=1 Tax=Actinomadura nitritigenes TaxID=134602 RepID=UPI003D8E220A